jgi:hypothetical protein
MLTFSSVETQGRNLTRGSDPSSPGRLRQQNQTAVLPPRRANVSNNGIADVKPYAVQDNSSLRRHCQILAYLQIIAGFTARVCSD